MVEEGGELGKFDQVLAGWRRIDGFMLERPGEVVGNEDGVDAGLEGGIDVGARAVADHPGAGAVAAVTGDEAGVSGRVLLGQDLDGSEVV